MAEKNRKYDEFYKAREFIADIIKKDLLGPVLEDENINEPPMLYYTTGKIYPKEQDSEILEMSSTSAMESDLDAYDTSLALTNMRNPRSMGITCTLKPSVETVRVCTNFAMYEPCKDDSTDKTISWKRHPYEFEMLINVSDFKESELLPGIFLKGYVQKVCRGGEIIFTLALINNREQSKDISKDMLFQPNIHISSADEANKKIFTSVMRQVEIKEEQELIEMDMLYSEYRCYGQGHGCSVTWGNEGNIETEEPDFVRSTFIPEYELKQMKAAKITDLPVLGMKYIIDKEPKEVINGLSAFAERYKKWIEEKLKDAGNTDERHKECASENIKKCRMSYERIKKSIELLKSSHTGDGIAWKSFVYANEAMLMQRIQTLKKQKRTVKEDAVTWYPFQLAFFLQELTSIINPESEDREIVDLLWFPTGGGKTEAYLGIAAFTIFYRRMKSGKEGEGVSVIMRYTLRLLTIQQFERASILICACEILRKKYDISDTPVEIGLWVGNGLTPGTLAEAEKLLKRKKAGTVLAADEADPCQVKICPWCGAELRPEDYSINRISGKMNIFCRNSECCFSGDYGLPVRLLDEEIYNHVPAFIVATVDKFAQITIKDEPASIFGVGKINNPPDLIIQDELHLISGPLGTMTGIYEAAITRICENNGIPVKIIASTATIRNAEKQINALYGRSHAQFPPQGISIDDSFFSVKSDKDESPSRLYIGYMGSGITLSTTMIRVYAAWLFASRYLIDLGYSDEVIDNFWTMTGYFNSLRELGGARTQVVDDIQSRYQYLKGSKFAHLEPALTGKDRYDFSEELTSRMNNDSISEIIQKGLKKSFNRKNSEDVYDFILASNMISVGVDIGRLGTMAVEGQPKTNSEYIQATSRVGRDNPGIVFTVLNPARSRDRSHYEQFLRYHSALYRYVESTSLTPFSDRARDRGLQALFVTLCRYLIDDLRDNSSAKNFDENRSDVRNIEKMIVDYVRRVDERELDDLVYELQDIKLKWQDQAVGELYYRKKNKKSLLKPDVNEDDRFRVMNSMRSVEKQSGIYLAEGLSL